MIKSIRLVNFLSFRDETIHFQPDVNILIGINGSGKSNLLKAIQLLQEGLFGDGLRGFLLKKFGGVAEATFGRNGHNQIQLVFTFDGPLVSQIANEGFRFTEDLIYNIWIEKTATDFSVKEVLKTKGGFEYLNFNSGKGFLHEKAEDLGRKIKGKPIHYNSFDSQQLSLRAIRESDSDRFYELSTILRALKEIKIYSDLDFSPASPIRSTVLPGQDKWLFNDGTNLPQVLNLLKTNHKSAFLKIVFLLKEVNPHFSGIDFRFLGQGLELLLEEDGLDRSIHVSRISNGTLHFLCLISVLYNPNRGRFICIDEPELGLHPDMLAVIADAVLEVGTEACLVISTHSDRFLSQFTSDQVRVFEKDEHNATLVKQFKDKELEAWEDGYNLGQLWVNGALGGNRYGQGN